MPQLRVSLGFTNATDSSIDEVAEQVLLKLFSNSTYPTPPVTSIDLTTSRNDFSASLAAASQGGPQQTADKNNKRTILVDQLRQLARYVQEKHGNDLAKLLGSGFNAVSTNRAQHPLTTPNIVSILNGNSGQLILRVNPVANVKCYEMRYALLAPDGSPGPYLNGGLHTNSRSIPLNGLTPGSSYSCQIRAIGGSTGYSDWSDAVSHMSM